MNVLVVGLNGYMGREVATLLKSGFKNMELVGGIDLNASDAFGVPCFSSFDEVNVKTDIIIDFSHHSNTNALLSFAVNNNLPLVLATTGQTDEELVAIKTASNKIPLFFASNYSMGIALLAELAKEAANAFPEADIEIVETHHNRKIDAPSGTALTLANEIASVREGAVIKTGRSGMDKRSANEIGIQSVRRGNIVGIHEVLVSTNNQTITLKHEAHSRALFAEGAISAASFLAGKPAGLYDMKSIIGK